MSDTPVNNPPADRKLALNVLVSSAKVDELKKNPPRSAPASPAASAGFLPHAMREAPALTDLESRIVEALRTVYDPEIPVNIYDLGLIYDILITRDEALPPPGQHRVIIKMTLTAPGCPVAGILPKTAERKVEEIDEVASCQVDLVWEPQWTKEMISEVARLDLGLM